MEFCCLLSRNYLRDTIMLGSWLVGLAYPTICCHVLLAPFLCSTRPIENGRLGSIWDSPRKVVELPATRSLLIENGSIQRRWRKHSLNIWKSRWQYVIWDYVRCWYLGRGVALFHFWFEKTNWLFRLVLSSLKQEFAITRTRKPKAFVHFVFQFFAALLVMIDLHSTWSYAYYTYLTIGAWCTFAQCESTRRHLRSHKAI